MSQEVSFSTIPEAPSLPNITLSMNSNTTPDSTSPDSKPDPNQVPLHLPLPKFISDLYPTLRLHNYNLKKESKPTNVLAFLHNATKREIADLLAVVIPVLETHPDDFISPENSQIGQAFHEWWRVLLRFFFFVAETNDEIINLMSAPVLKYLKKRRDIKALNNLERHRKSITDRYEFTMEIVFRAADRSLKEMNKQNLIKVIDKLHVLAKFVLKTLELVMTMAEDLVTIAPELDISNLEQCIADNLSAFAKDDKPVFIYICARWMNTDEYTRCWIIKYGGMWARMMIKTWEKTHQEQRAHVIEQMAGMLNTPCLPAPRVSLANIPGAFALSE